MYRLKVKQMLEEFEGYKPGDLVRIDLWFGRVLTLPYKKEYDVNLSTADGIIKKRFSENQMHLSYPVEFAINWNGCGGNARDILTDKECNDIKANHPVIYQDCLKKVAMNTSYGSLIEDWVYSFLMTDKNRLNGKPETVIEGVKKSDYGPIMKYVKEGEELSDAIIRLRKEAVYVTPDNKYVFMSY